MKKIVLGGLLMTAFASVSLAQKGSILVYGAMGVRTEKKPNGDRTTQFSINPGIGYQFSKNWTAGITGGYGHEKFSPAGEAESESNDYKAGGFTRYTHEFNPIFSLYGQGEVYYHGTKVNDIKSNGIGIALVPAIGINISNNFALNVSFGGISYETIKIKDAGNATKTFDMDFGHEIRIGVSKNFGGKK